MAKRPDSSLLPVIVAHRGASFDAPENTIAAFRLAWEQQADAIEGDFRMTADGQIACYHDPQVTFRDGSKRDVSTVTLAELSGMGIPSIADVFAATGQDKRIFVEVKCGTEILPELLSRISDSGLREDQITIISFNREVIAGLKALNPAIKANWLVKFKRNRLNLSPGVRHITRILDEIKADGVGLQASRKLTRSFVSAIKNAGFECHVWTVDSPSLARKFAHLGMDSITTNRPGFIRSCLEQGPMFH